MIQYVQLAHERSPLCDFSYYIVMRTGLQAGMGFFSGKALPVVFFWGLYAQGRFTRFVGY